MSLAQVKEFHEAFGHPVAEKRMLINKDRYQLRKTLIREEMNETLRDYINGDLVKTADGLADLDVVINGTLLEFGFTTIHPEGEEYYTFEGRETPKLLDYGHIVHSYSIIVDDLRTCDEAYYEGNVDGIISALIHSKYIVAYTAASLGIPLREVCDAVHKANMSKLGEDGKPIYRETDNKILKGPNFRPPEEDIERILKEHGADL